MNTHVLAHAFGARYELPIPLVAFVLGGAAVVAVSFAAVLPTRAEPRAVSSADRTHVRPVTWLGGIVGLVLLAALCWAGLAGAQEVAENILPTVFWVFVWVLVPMLCGLVGDFTSGSNPFGFLAQLGGRIGRHKRAWPGWLGWWPAVALLAGGTLAELVFNLSTTLPRFIGWMLIGYAAYCVVMGALFGGDAFRGRGELFSVLFDTWGRLGYFRFGAPGRRGFAGGLDVPFERSISRTVFVLMLLISISFDGVLSTPQWNDFERRHAGTNLHSQYVLRIAVFLAVVLIIYLVFLAFSLGVKRVAGDRMGTRETLARLLPSLVPIAYGYLFAHYLQYVLINGQLILPLLGAPGGSGTDLGLPYPFNDSYEPNRNILPNSVFWYIDVVAIVAAHIAAIVVAHRALAGVGTTERTTRRAEFPWVVAMIGYTALSLWLLAQPLTEAASTHSS